jgi:flagellar hook-associated protein 1 FlgK
MNTASLFDSALAGLQAAQAGMMVTSQNVAGASVDGYVRRSPLIQDIAMSSSTADPAGSTFAVEGFTRNFNALLQGQINAQTGTSVYSKTLIDGVSSLDSTLVDPATSIAAAMGAFFNSVGSLGNQPGDASYQSDLLGTAAQLVDRIHTVSGVISNTQASAKQGLVDALNESNSLTSELANINAKIRGAGVPGVGYPTADLLDQRDRVLSRLSELLGGHAVIDSTGAASFEVSGVFLVNQDIANPFTNSSGFSPITADQDVSGIRVKVDGHLIPIQLDPAVSPTNPNQPLTTTTQPTSLFSSGKAGAYVKLLNDFLPSLNQVLAVTSAMLVHHVNQFSSTNPAPSAGQAYDPNALFGFVNSKGANAYPGLGNVDTQPDLYKNLLQDSSGNWLTFDQVMQNIKTQDPQTMAALKNLGDTIDPSRLVAIGQYTADKFSVLNSSAAPPTGSNVDPNVTGTRSNMLESLRNVFSAPITYLTSSAATTMANWKSNDTANQSLLSSLNTQKESISGVNLDEEAANLVKYQQLYNASSKVIQTSKQMFDTLLAMMTGN